MKNFFKILSCLFVLTASLQAQQKKDITLKEIWQGAFRTQYMNQLNSMNGDYYSLLSFDKNTNTSAVEKYSYKTLTKVATVVSSKDISELQNFQFYNFNNDESKLILGTKISKIYRRSSKGDYYIFDLKTKKTQLIDKQIQEPTFSPDSKKVAYVKANNLFIKNLVSGKLIQVTQDGKINSVINGIADWVYEEEFMLVRAFQWSKDSKNIAFLRFDEAKVPSFSMDLYGNGLYPEQQVFKYPKAGEDNAKVSLHLYDLSTQTKKDINLGNYEYIPRIQWTNQADVLSVTTLNRHQNKLKLFFVNAGSTKASLILSEQDKAYVDVQDNLTFLKDNSFIWTSEQDGFNHIYLYDKSGKLKHQITRGKWDVTNYYGYNSKTNQIYYQSVENGSINRGVYKIGLDGRNKKMLTPNQGQSNASFSKNMTFFINSYSSSTKAPVFSLYYNDKKIKTIKDNKELEKKLTNYNVSDKVYSTIEINGNNLNMWMIKPLNFDAKKKYPLLLFQYSGPGSQKVSNRWNDYNDYWHQLLAQKGIVVACVDGRGTGFKGRDFKKITQLQLGKYEVEDQIAVAKKLTKLPFINPKKVGIWGWSFGGFMSTNCLLKGNDVFSMAIAVAPVTSWRFYDTVYTERYMKTPQENASGYDDNSPLNYPEKLKGKYLLIHGSGDDNVHVQNTMRMINALIKVDKEFDTEIYPDRTHSIYKGANTRLNLYKKMTRFLQENLLKD